MRFEDDALELGNLDLRLEHRDDHLSTIEFKKFTDEVQVAIRSAGRATYWTKDGLGYHAVYPPKEESK